MLRSLWIKTSLQSKPASLSLSFARYRVILSIFNTSLSIEGKMSRVKVIVLTIVSILFITMTMSWASWRYFSIKDLVAQSQIIIEGKIECIEEDIQIPYSDDDGTYKVDLGYIRVEEVLKNTSKDVDIQVGDPFPVASFSISRTHLNTRSTYYREGRGGIWMLQQRDRIFWANHPKRLQKRENKSLIYFFIMGFEL